MTVRLTVRCLDRLTKLDPLTKVWPGRLQLVAIAVKLPGTEEEPAQEPAQETAQ